MPSRRDGYALFGEDANERRTGSRAGFGMAVLRSFAGVDGERHGCGGAVAGEVLGNGSCISKFLAWLAAEVDAQKLLPVDQEHTAQRHGVKTPDYGATGVC